MFLKNKITDLKYVFNGSKATEKEVKEAFKGLFESKKEEIFNAMSSNLKKELEIENLVDIDAGKINESLTQL